MIQAQNLVKQYGQKTAVRGISFTVSPGQVTGFLGPNGAGKSTTMRMIMGLDQPNQGQVTVNGLPFAQHKAPLHQVGALLDAKAFHPGRSAYDHLRSIAATHNIPTQRVNEVIELTGLSAVAKKRAGGFSLGMGQRLGIATALLGDPQTLILDEPVNGLDPEGVLWVRNFVRYLASQGKTVFLSSHLMSEMSQTADHVIIIGRGRIIRDSSMADLIAENSGQKIRVRTQQLNDLSQLLAGIPVTAQSTPGVPGQVTVTPTEPETIEVVGLASQQIAQIALDNKILLYELTPMIASLEDVYLEVTKDDVEYNSSFTSGQIPGAHAAAGNTLPPEGK